MGCTFFISQCLTFQLGTSRTAYVPATIIFEMRRQHWSKDTYVIPEYTFGFECQKDIQLSHEHTEHVWLTYEEANQKLKWDSNRTALFELNCWINHFINEET